MKHINFNRFDGAHTENFCSAALLLAMDSDKEVHKVVVEMLLKPLENAPKYDEFLSIVREQEIPEISPGETPDNETKAVAKRRPDLTLCFETESGKREIIVEVKTSIRNWKAESVLNQLKGYGGEDDDVILLAPRRLCEEVDWGHYINWEDLLRCLRELEPREEPAESVIKHLEEHVERSGGIPDMDIEDLEEKIHHIAAVRSFLHECIEDIRGTPTIVDGKDLWLTGHDGNLKRKGALGYHGMAVVFKHDDDSYALGVYKFVDVPDGTTARSSDGYWLQAIKFPWKEASVPRVLIPFDPEDLSRKETGRVKKSFIEEWEGRGASAATDK